MTRAVQHIQLNIADSDFIALFQPLIRGKCTTWLHTEHLALLCQPVNPECIFLLRANDRHIKVLCHISGCADMIKMTVRQENFIQFKAALFNFTVNQKTAGFRRNA